MINDLYATQFKSPIGWISILADDTSIREIKIGTRTQLPRSENSVLKKARHEMMQYFSGKRQTFSVPLSFNGTPFQEKVWNTLTKVPFGQVTSYSELAKRIGHPAASRAVGNALSKNAIPILIPCHRVIASGGRLGGFTGGVQKKIALLSLEGLSRTFV